MEHIQHFINNKKDVYRVATYYYSRYRINGGTVIFNNNQCTMVFETDNIYTFTDESGNRHFTEQTYRNVGAKRTVVLKFGWSKFNTEDKQFSRKKGLALARERLRYYDFNEGIPEDLPEDLHTVFLFHLGNMLCILKEKHNKHKNTEAFIKNCEQLEEKK